VFLLFSFCLAAIVLIFLAPALAYLLGRPAQVIIVDRQTHADSKGRNFFKFAVSNSRHQYIGLIDVPRGGYERHKIGDQINIHYLTVFHLLFTSLDEEPPSTFFGMFLTFIFLVPWLLCAWWLLDPVLGMSFSLRHKMGLR